MSTEKFSNLSEVNLFTRSECEKILAQVQGNNSKSGKFLLKDFTVEPELQTIGYLGQYFHLTLSYTAAAAESDVDDSVVLRQQRLFVKTLPYKNAELCQYVVKTGILRKEISLYSTLLKELRKFSITPLWAECLYTRDDLFVMQNLNELGYKPSISEFEKFQSLEMKSLLKGLAQMHASSVTYEFSNEINIGEMYQDALQEITVSPQESYFTTGVRAIIAVTKGHPQYQNTEHKKYIEEKLETDLNSVYEMVNPSMRYHNVFCHRDPWGGNILFNRSLLQNYATVPVMFVDFQTCRYCPAAIDVIFAIYMNLSVEELKNMETFYLDWYYKCFTEALNALNCTTAAPHMCREEFFNSYWEFQLFGFLYRAIAATILHVPNNYLSNLKLNNPELYYKYAYVDRTAEVLSLMNDSREFRQYMQQCVGDMMNSLCLSGKCGDINHY